MKNIFKRTIAIVLVLIMVVSVITPAALAEKAKTQNSKSEMEMVTQSGLGMIANNLMSAEDDEDYSIISIKVIGKTATLELHISNVCTLVVAVYDEKTEKMLASGVEKIEANTDLAEVEIDIKTMPKKFIVKAFLLGRNNNALCKEFVSMEYTTAFQTYMQKTPDDYAGEEIIIFDSNDDVVNFAVLDNGVISSEKTASMTFAYNEETKTYTFENSTDDVKNLKAGDVYYYEYGTKSNEFLLFKVKSISVLGSMVKIVQDETIDLRDAFKFIRIDAVSDFSDVKVDESQLGEALISVKAASFANNKGIDFNKKTEFEKSFGIGYEVSKGNTKVSITGSLGVCLSFNVNLYYDCSLFGEDYYEFKLDEYAKFSFDVVATGKYALDKDLLKIPLVKIPVGAFTINVELAPVFEVTASLTFFASLEIYDKISADSTNGLKKYRTVDTETNLSLRANFEVKIGAEITLSVSLVEIVELAFVGEGGAKFIGTVFYNNNVIHTCKTCIDGDCFAYYDIKVKFKMCIVKDVVDLEIVIPAFSDEFELFEFYISFPEMGGVVFGKGNCPNIKEKEPDTPGSTNYGLTGDEKVGDIIEFGSYPQSQIADSSLISELNKISKTWKSYRYYDGTMMPGDWMKYADVTYNGNKYRAVTFSEYRPFATIIHNFDIISQQEVNGYYKNTVYWFKYEPILWRVLNPKDGLVLCVSIIDSQPYNNTIYNNFYVDENCTTWANVYSTSSIREWLNCDFYNTAFTNTEKNEIKKSVQNNSHIWVESETNDKIFLLSVDDVFNTVYGFLCDFVYDENKAAQGTDYAKCQGLEVNESTCEYCNGKSWWWLRTHGEYADDVWLILSGDDCYGGGAINSTDCGVRPAMKLKTATPNSVEYVSKKIYSNGAVATDSLFDVSIDNCIAGNSYILMNVADYKNDFELSTENLYFINQFVADVSGRINTQFIPKISDTNGITLIVGDFGKGVEVKKVVSDNLGEKFTELRLLDATAYKNGDTITVFTSKDAERTAIYPTTKSGETVFVKTTGVPISVSSKGAFVLKFIDWHKNNNKAETTIVVGNTTYNLNFVFNVDDGGHDYFTVITKPTETQKGYTTYTCSICDYSYVGNYVAAFGKVESVKVSDIFLDYKSSSTFVPDIKLTADIGYEVEYSSSNESVATVDKDGNVTATGTGEAEITVTVTDEYGNVVEDICKVTVSYAWWQWLIIIFLFGWIWY